MSKLSRIEDVEARQAAQQAARAEASADTRDTPPENPEHTGAEQPRTLEPKPEPEPVPEPEPQPQAKADDAPAAQPQKRSLADQEEDFHGISTAEPLGMGHTVLRAAAVIVFLCAVAFVLNYWFHFV